MEHEPSLTRLERFRLLDLTTFRRSGTSVTTPVRFAVDGGRVVVSLQVGSGKVKRLRADPRVRIAGHGDSLSLEATVRELQGEEARVAYGVLRRRHPLLTFQRFIFGRHPRTHVCAEIRLV